MRLFDVFAVGLNVGQICFCLTTLARLLSYSRAELEPCFSDPKVLISWSGTSIYWLLLEIAVFFIYLATMIILLAKSRFFKVGIDNSKMFSPRYASYMVNRIIDAMIE